METGELVTMDHLPSVGDVLKIDLATPGLFCAGLGDCVTWAWIAAGSTRPLQFFARGSNAEMLRLFGCDVTEDNTDAIDPSFGYRAETNTGCKIPRVEIWKKVLQIGGTVTRPSCTRNPIRNPNPRRIMLAPHCNFVSRTWPAAYWLDLNWSLLHAGYEVVWLMAHNDQTYVNRGPSMAFWGNGFSTVIDLMMTCELVVGNDSMPAHLAGTLGLPVLALMGPTSPNVFAHIPNVVAMQSDAVKCVGCHFGAPYRAGCGLGCQSLFTLLPQNIMAEIEQRVSIQKPTLRFLKLETNE
jgi:hypothetical protein